MPPQPASSGPAASWGAAAAAAVAALDMAPGQGGNTGPLRRAGGVGARSAAYDSNQH